MYNTPRKGMELEIDDSDEAQKILEIYQTEAVLKEKETGKKYMAIWKGKTLTPVPLSGTRGEVRCMKKFICAVCGRYVLGESKYDEKVRKFVFDFGVDIDEFDDSEEICVIARCKYCMPGECHELIDLRPASGTNFYCEGSARCPVCQKRVLLFQRPAAKGGKLIHDPRGKCPYCGAMLMFPRKYIEALKKESKDYPHAVIELSRRHVK